MFRFQLGLGPYLLELVGKRLLLGDLQHERNHRETRLSWYKIILFEP